jgi:hypothetical protein
METPLSHLRGATADLHQGLETLPYARAVLDASVAMPLHAGSLRAVDLVHPELERAVALASDVGLWAALEKRPELQR